jgi:7,8-dihydropterin-6-yl-methyl-4-(beta-D-ribofuranosyl)aminobenzene 5'-phosphate synthase
MLKINTFLLITLVVLGVCFSLKFFINNKGKNEIAEMLTKHKQEKLSSNSQITKEKVTLITIYDNFSFNPELKTGWGFACLIKYQDKNILFDTGAESSTLLSNMEKLEIDPDQIDIIVLSHNHHDHTGGLFGLLKENSQVKVFLPQSFPQSFKDQVEDYGSTVVEIDQFSPIINGVYSTGQLGISIKEQSLIVDSNKGLVILTGCAHPGIMKIIKRVKANLDKKIYLVMGGFHLSSASDSQLNQIIKEFSQLGVEKAAPCHCSGERCRQLFKEKYGNNYLENGVGKIIKI